MLFRSRIRNQARALLAATTEVRAEKEKRLLNFLSRIGLAKEGTTLDDILNLKVEDLLERRLQTIIMKRSGAKSPYRARQIVSHGHVSIGNRKINRPGYIVRTDEEGQILVHVEVAAPSTPEGAAATPAS